MHPAVVEQNYIGFSKGLVCKVFGYQTFDNLRGSIIAQRPNELHLNANARVCLILTSQRRYLLLVNAFLSPENRSGPVDLSSKNIDDFQPETSASMLYDKIGALAFLDNGPLKL